MTDHAIRQPEALVRALLHGHRTQARFPLKRQPPEWATFCQQLQTMYVGRGWAPSGLWQWCEPETTPPRTLRRWPVHETGPMEGIDYGLRPPYAVGDRLWVRENWRICSDDYGWPDYEKRQGFKPEMTVIYSDAESHEGPIAPVEFEPPRNAKRTVHGAVGHPEAWTEIGTIPSIHMPRWASRLTLIVEAVKVERLQAISEADAEAEGAAKLVGPDDDGKFYVSADGTFKCGFAGIWTHINGAGAWDSNPWVVAVTFCVVRANIDAPDFREHVPLAHSVLVATTAHEACT
jgi:hypothetical protein